MIGGRARLRIATVGAGRWGELHAGKLAAHPHVELVAMVDIDHDRAVAAARRHGARRAVTNLAALRGAIDAVTIAVPIQDLSGVAMQALEIGAHILVEKPAGVDKGAVLALSEFAKNRKLVGAVGFLERFNGAIESLTRPVRRLVAWRGAPIHHGKAGLDVDWAIHDIDLAGFLFDEAITRSECIKRSVDEVVFRLLTASGKEARVHARGNSSSVRRRLWADGCTYDLVHGARDPLGREIDAFVRALRGTVDGRLALLGDAAAALGVIEAAAMGSRAAA